MNELHTDLKALGVSKANNESLYKSAQETSIPYSVLERFPSPSGQPDMNKVGSEQTIKIETSEFTSLCPITGQPDFATIYIEYTPNKWCVESKALELYLLTYRNRGHFHEAIVNDICNDLAELLNPTYLKVVGKFTPRGGIQIHPESEFWGSGDEYHAYRVPLTYDDIQF